MTAVARNIADVMKFRKEPAATRYLPYSYHVTDEIISTVNGEYVVMFKLRGRAHETAPDSDLVRWVLDFNHLIRTIGDERIRIWTHEHRRQASEFEQSDFKLHFAKTFNAKYLKKFEDQPLMVNDLYLSIVFHPIGDVTQQLLSKVERPSAEEQADMRDEAISIVEDIASQVKGALRPYGIEQLGIYYRDERGSIINTDDERKQSEELAELESGSLDDADDDLLDVDTQSNTEPNKVRKYSYSSALEFLGFLCNGAWEPVPVCRNRIRSYLMNVRPVSSKWGDVIQLRGIDSVSYTCGLELREYSDEETEPGQLNILKEADFEYVLTQSFSCMSVQAAGGLLSRQEKALMEVNDAGKSQINAMERAKDDVKSRRFVMGFHHCTLHLFGKTAKEAQKHARQAKVLMNQCGIIAQSVGLASEAAFYARLPANQQFIPRPTAINSWNFICFSSFHNFMTGKPANNPWGPAVTILTGIGGGPVFFNWHVSPLNADWYGKRPAGHTLILGKTGAGKTTTLDGLITESSKYNPRGYFFDKDQGMMPLVTALEGKYQVLREGEPSGMQPLQMAPTKANVGLAKRLLRTCVEITNNGPIEPLEVEQLNDAVEHVMASGVVPLELRSVTAVARQLPRPARTSAAQRVSLAELIAPWCWGGEHGWALDNPSDLLDLSTHRNFGFDLTEFIAADDALRIALEEAVSGLARVGARGVAGLAGLVGFGLIQILATDGGVTQHRHHPRHLRRRRRAPRISIHSSRPWFRRAPRTFRPTLHRATPARHTAQPYHRRRPRDRPRAGDAHLPRRPGHARTGHALRGESRPHHPRLDQGRHQDPDRPARTAPALRWTSPPGGADSAAHNGPHETPHPPAGCRLGVTAGQRIRRRPPSLFLPH